jgi:hypothetical protein
MVINESQNAPEAGERSLEIEDGSHVEFSVPGEGLYYFTEWAALSPDHQEFFQVILAAHRRILDEMAEALRAGGQALPN